MASDKYPETLDYWNYRTNLGGSTYYEVAFCFLGYPNRFSTVFFMGNPKMDKNWRYPPFRKPPHGFYRYLCLVAWISIEFSRFMDNRIITKVPVRSSYHCRTVHQPRGIPNNAHMSSGEKYIHLVGGLEHLDYFFPFSWEFHHPN